MRKHAAKFRPRERRLRATRSCGGFILLDVIGGLLLLGAVTLLLGVAISKHARVSSRLEHDRAASRLAEHAALALAAAPTTMPANVEVTPLDTAAPKDHRWYRVTATVDGTKATLIALGNGGTR